MVHSDDDISLFAPCVDMPVSVSHLFKCIAAINHRAKYPRFDKLKQEGQIFILCACRPQPCEYNLCLLAQELRRPEHLPQNCRREDGGQVHTALLEHAPAPSK